MEKRENVSFVSNPVHLVGHYKKRSKTPTLVAVLQRSGHVSGARTWGTPRKIAQRQVIAQVCF